MSPKKKYVMNMAAATVNEPLRYLRGFITAFSLYLSDAADADRHVENPAELPAVVSSRAAYCMQA